MAKLIVLALAFTALVAFASSHKTIVTTTIIKEQDPSSRKQCSQELQGESFNQCQNYIQQKQGLQQCCEELDRVNQQCQCEAVEQVFREAQQQQQQQQGQQGESHDSQQIQKMMKRAQKLPSRCNIETKQCQIGNIFTTTTITENIFGISGRGSQQQCREIVQQESFNQCQKFITQQISGSPRTLLMSINRQGQQPQGMKQCCNELENVKEECQCEAMQQLYKKAIQQQQQQGSQQGSQFGGQQQQMEEVRQMIQNLRNQCELEVEQCRIPSAMF